MSPLEKYQQALASKEFMPDSIQESAIKALNARYQELIKIDFTQLSTSSYNKTSFIRRFKPLSKLLKSNQNQQPNFTPSAVRGLYMWGGVGRGKTWMMDIFYHSLPAPYKKRLHFHRFMHFAHEKLNAHQGETNPIESIADEIVQDTRILCFDEFFVSDITDAMILGNLLEALFKRGVTLIATSNIPPDELYKNGLQRTRFLPAIESIKAHCDIMNIDSGIDYRLRTLTQASLFHFPLNEENKKKLHILYEQLSGEKVSPHPKIISINHHNFQIESEANGIALIDFQTLCVEPRSPQDFIELSRSYHSVILQNITLMSRQDESAARRFIGVIDEFYERKVKLILSSVAPIDTIYQGELLRFEFKRCLSRLQEMQSHEYLAIPHIP
ncbi:cell division protein ZapE [Thorsellia kenyensis]|uniref:Cell division protein ZapE n=1 Tax=Thorsellia kenyensis TaxID=1549888 RepID=A0ABV6CEI1_9GAMM